MCFRCLTKRMTPQAHPISAVYFPSRCDISCSGNMDSLISHHTLLIRCLDVVVIPQ
uniref:Uncharacterized protein n=1 Tax=Setaria viridis TaxID=4556 RepID=A0A4U6T1E0_SETVI|nr:hypothetical protein SEVIR_9G288800v2 [Setaria viridis]